MLTTGINWWSFDRAGRRYAKLINLIQDMPWLIHTRSTRPNMTA